MARPALEETYRIYSESYVAWNGSGNGNYPFNLRDYVRTFSGTTSPGFPKYKRYNTLAVMSSRCISRPLQGFFRDYPYVPPGPYVYDKGTFVFRSPTYTIPSGGPSEFGLVEHEPNAYRISIDKAMDRVLDRKVNIAQFIAERKQVVNTIDDVVKRLTKAIHAVRRRDYKGAASALGLKKHPKNLSGNIAKDWLAFQYGWKPLLADVKGAAELLAEQELNRDVRIKIRAKTKRPLDPFVAISGTLGVPNCVTYRWLKGHTDATTILEFLLTNDFKRLGGQIGITDPLTLAWELIPYSFVVDWFLPVGNFLQRLNYDSGLIYQGGSTTLFSLREFSADVEFGASFKRPDNFTTKLDGGNATVFKSFRLNRYLHVTPPRAVFPDFKDPFSVTHLLNSLALLRVAFGRK